MPTVSFQDLGRPNMVPLRHWNMHTEMTPQGPQKTRRMPRPGLVQVNDLGFGPIRASFKFGANRVTVSGAQVYFNNTPIGVVPITGIVRYAISDQECVVVANRRAYYVTSSSVAIITDPDLPQVKDVVFLAGRFLYFDADTSGIYRWSDINDARNIAGLSFASAESSPDPITGALIIGDNVFITGSETGEWHYPTDDISVPFQRSKGRRYDKGSPAIRSLVLADNAGFFVGSDRTVYRTSQVPSRVSDSDMEDRLQQMTDDELTRINCYRVDYSGHVFYVVNMPRLGSWAYDIAFKTWIRWASWAEEIFRIECAGDGVYGDNLTGYLYRFDRNAYTDNGLPIERICSLYLPVDKQAKNTNVVLRCAQGVGLPIGYGSDPKVEMRFSDHQGGDFTNWMEANLGLIGDRTKGSMAEWISLGAFERPGRLYEFRCTDPVFFSPYELVYNQQRA